MECEAEIKHIDNINSNKQRDLPSPNVKPPLIKINNKLPNKEGSKKKESESTLIKVILLRGFNIVG